MTDNPSEWADVADVDMPDPSPARIRARELYELELDHAAEENAGERVDLVNVRKRTARRLASEWGTQPLALAQLAVQQASIVTHRQRAPRFQSDGSVTLRLDAMLRVDDDEVIPARYAREDDWLAYVAISRANADRIAADQAAKELGVARIVGDLRAAGYGARTFEVRPELFVDEPEADVG